MSLFNFKLIIGINKCRLYNSSINNMIAYDATWGKQWTIKIIFAIRHRRIPFNLYNNGIWIPGPIHNIKLRLCNTLPFEYSLSLFTKEHLILLCKRYHLIPIKTTCINICYDCDNGACCDHFGVTFNIGPCDLCGTVGDVSQYNNLIPLAHTISDIDEIIQKQKENSILKDE